MIQLLIKAYKLRPKRPSNKTWSFLTLIINGDYIVRLPEMKSKYTDTSSFPPDIALMQEINTTD